MSTAWAHHAVEVHYTTDESEIVTYSGVVKSFSPLNPHIYLVVSVEHEGSTRDWVLEGQGGAILARAGWRFDTLATGTQVEFAAFPARSGESAGRIHYVRVGDVLFCSDRCDLIEGESLSAPAGPMSVTLRRSISPS